MPWKYCRFCNQEVGEPEIEDFQYGEVPKCECGEPVECDKEEIIIDAIIALKERLKDEK